MSNPVPHRDATINAIESYLRVLYTRQKVNSDRQRQIEHLHRAALEREPHARRTFLEDACRDDADLRREVEILLAQDDATVTQLTAGALMGPYRIEAPLGAGGMGEVYRAVDTRLGRKVAIKISAEQFSNRFEREARAISALNHPHICTLYDIGPNYLVMELVEGETLAQRLKRGALSLEQTSQYGAQIADALAAAHAKGITHRDLKPGNIMITKAGVKVLDFGLAKSGQDETLTASRAVMGTPAYMAPEQREGKECDARTDIYALGLVLYEMATGKRLAQDQALALDGLPEKFAHVVERCLHKDPESRWQNVRDIAAELEWAAKASAPKPAPAGGAPAARWWIAAVAVLLVVLVSGWALSRFRQPAVDGPALRLQLEPPEGGQFTGLALSPDGRTAAYVAAVKGKTGLWVQSLDGVSARLLPGTEGATFPFWSPDGKSIGFFSGSKLLRVDLAGGAPVTICYVSLPRGGTWENDGRILFANGLTGLFQVAASGGTPAPLTTLDGDRSRSWPQMLPGGRFLYLARSDNPENTGVYAASLAKPRERVKLLNTDSAAVYAAGGGKSYLLWSRSGTLVAQEFNPSSFQLMGEPGVVADGIAGGSIGYLQVATSGAGLLLYASSSQDQLTWLDREGEFLGAVGEPGAFRDFNLSPDGRYIALSRTTGAGGFDLWLLEVERGVASRFTLGPGSNIDPLWSPDGRSIVFTRIPDLYRKELNGAGPEQRIAESPRLKDATSWSRDGRHIIYYGPQGDTKRDLWILPMPAEGKTSESAKPRPYLRTPFNESIGRFSPEPSPHWVAYQSDESGRYEIYIQAFPEPHGKLQISTGGGESPKWSPVPGKNGYELFYVSPENKLMVVNLKLGNDSVAPSAPRELFPLPPGSEQYAQYEVSADGKRFLVKAPLKTAQPLTVVVNWPAMLKSGATAPLP